VVMMAKVRRTPVGKLLPLVPSVDRRQAAPLAIGAAEHDRRADRVGARVARPRGARGLLGPMWNQPPAQHVQAALARLRVAVQHGGGIGRGNPPGGREIRQRHIEGEAELPGKFVRGATKVIEAAHAATLRLSRRTLNTPRRP
jgi:hypothetical protein